jgi:hypothetical protein
MTIKQVYFIGIGGIGMSNLARYYHSRSCRVAGYDRTETELTKQLVKEGMEIHYRDDVEAIPEAFKEVNTTLVVRTPAVSETHSELQYFRSAGFRIVKRAEVLGEISRELDALCVAGTHGKTTTSTLLAHLLRQSSLDCNAFGGYRQSIVCLEKGVFDRQIGIDAKKLLIVYHQQGVHIFAHFLHAVQSLIYFRFSFPAKRNGDNSNGEYVHFAGYAGNNRRCSRPSASAHSGGYKYHAGMFAKSCLDIFHTFFGSRFGNFGMITGTQTFGSFWAQLEFIGYGRIQHGLLVGIAYQVVYITNSFTKHISDGITTSSAHSYHFDDCRFSRG